jgi:hypothetical protein
MPLTLPHTFVDGPGNIASGEQVMDNLNAINAGVFMATVTSLPASPVNGQECFYLADATNGVVWHLKYRSASASAYKWECVGGGAMQAEITTLEIRSTTGAFGDMATIGPSVTVPLAGDYDITVEAWVETAPVAGTFGEIAPQIGAAVPAASGPDVAFAGASSAQVTETQTGRTLRRTVATPATVVKITYLASSTTTRFGNRHLEIRPVRVG